MKTPEDEAFEDIERRQGGGFPAKRAMAADKFIAAEERKVGERYGYVPKLHPSEWMDESAQEPVARVLQIIKELRPAIKPMEGMGKGKTTADWFDILVKEIERIQPAQEPVAWITPDGEGFRIRFSAPTNDVPLGWDALYTTPPKREWVGLTDEEISVVLTGDASLAYNLDDLNPSWIELVQKVEAKLKEKNA
jgi:hypothetical protein